MMPSFFDVASTCQKPASVTSLLDLPLVGIQTFLEGVMVLPDSGQVGGASSSDNSLEFHFKPLDVLSRSLMFAFVRAQEDFLF
jgi:hypothetical protein